MRKPETWTGFEVRRTDWFGDDDLVKGGFMSHDDAKAFADRCNRESRAVDDPRDRIHYAVVEYTFTDSKA